MDKYELNKEVYLDEAYKLLQAGYSTIKLSKSEFIEQVMKAPEKFGIIEDAYMKPFNNKVVTQGRFGGWNDLKSILKECLGLLDKNSMIVAELARGHSIFQLNVLTSKFQIKIRRDNIQHVDVLSITLR